MRQAGTKDFTPEQRRKINEIVYTGMLTRRTTEEMQMQVENKVNVIISENTLKQLRSKIRKEAQQELLNMKKDNDLFTYQYMEDIHQVDLLIRHQWSLFETVEDSTVKSNCLDRIHNYTITRHKLYDFLPSLYAMKPFEETEKLANLDSGSCQFKFSQ
jgi:excinuclease UvrABC helicase subunit UvrB